MATRDYSLHLTTEGPRPELLPLRKLQDRTRVFQEALSGLQSDVPLTQERVEDVLPLLDKEFGFRRGTREEAVLREFFLQGLMEIPDQVFIERQAKVLAGWWYEFLGGLPFPGWAPGHLPCWNLFYVESVERLPVRVPLYSCLFEARAGMACGQRFPTQLPRGFLLRALREIGGRRFAEYKATDFGGLWVRAFLSYQKNRCQFDGIHAVGTYLEHNRKVLRLREGPCRIRKDWPECFNCYFGRDRCMLSRHKAEYPWGPCDGHHSGYIVSNGLCLFCLDNERFVRGKDTANGD